MRDGRILSFTIVLPLAEGMAELDGIFVEPEFMKRGVGRALLQDAFSMARAQGVRRIEVTSNPRAVGFYEKIGFVADGPVPTRFGPALRMHVEIRQECIRAASAVFQSEEESIREVDAFTEAKRELNGAGTDA